MHAITQTQERDGERDMWAFAGSHLTQIQKWTTITSGWWMVGGACFPLAAAESEVKEVSISISSNHYKKHPSFSLNFTSQKSSSSLSLSTPLCWLYNADNVATTDGEEKRERFKIIPNSTLVTFSLFLFFFLRFWVHHLFVSSQIFHSSMSSRRAFLQGSALASASLPPHFHGSYTPFSLFKHIFLFRYHHHRLSLLYRQLQWLHLLLL